MTRIYLHALGGGHGHLRRAWGLSRALVASGADVKVGVPFDHPGARWLERQDVESLPLSPGSPRPSREALGELDLFIADALPCGVTGELAGLEPGCPRVLLQRFLRDERGLDTYPHRVDIEPVPPRAGLGPVLVPSDARAEADVVLVGGDDRLDGFLDRLAERLRGLGVSHAVYRRRRGEGAPDPLAPVPLVGARCVVGAAGYHLVHEARAAGVVHLAVPRPRRFDDQARRARLFATPVSSPPQLFEMLLRALEQPRPKPVLPQSFEALARHLLGLI